MTTVSIDKTADVPPVPDMTESKTFNETKTQSSDWSETDIVMCLSACGVAIIVLFGLIGWVTSPNQLDKDTNTIVAQLARQMELMHVKVNKMETDLSLMRRHLNISQDNTSAQNKKNVLEALKHTIEAAKSDELEKECDKLYQEVIKTMQDKKLMSIDIWSDPSIYRGAHQNELSQCLRGFGFKAAPCEHGRKYAFPCMTIAI